MIANSFPHQEQILTIFSQYLIVEKVIYLLLIEQIDRVYKTEWKMVRVGF